MENLSYADAGIVVVLVLLSIRGIWQGLIRGSASFLGIILGVFYASRFYQNVGEWFAKTLYDFQSPEINYLIGFLILITIIWAACLVIGEIVFRMIKLTPLTALDGALGLLFGFAKAFVIISVIIFGISQVGWLKNFSQNLESKSSLFPIMKKLAIDIMNLEPAQEIKENLNDMGIDSILDKSKDALEKKVSWLDTKQER